MTKRIVALILCIATVLLCFVGCATNEDDKGAFIRMYLTEPVYDVDPLLAFDNEATLQIVSLLFDGLFYADEQGNPQKALVRDYNYSENAEEGEYILNLYLNGTKWSDGVAVTANDAQYAFRRLLAPGTAHPAASLLYDIKNARAVAEGNDSVDHLGVTVISQDTLQISFDHPINVNEFLLVLCSPALYPLRDDIIEANPDWSKKSSTIVTSGAFMVRSMDFQNPDGFVLERNSYYYRDRTKDALDKYVTPYRIVIDYSTDPADQYAMLGSGEAGAYYHFGRIPLDIRDSEDFNKDSAWVSDAPSTHVYYLNQNAVINGEKLFANEAVRKALSIAIDREAIAEALVFARAANGLVPYTLRNKPDSNAQFRDAVEDAIATTANFQEAKNLLSSANITASKYSFCITVASYDEDHLAMANLVKAAWTALGFKVSLNVLTPTEIIEYVDHDNNEVTPPIKQATGIYDNPYKDAIDDLRYTVTENDVEVEKTVEVIALDLVAYSPDAFHYLAQFAKQFSGNQFNIADYTMNPHITGYDSEEYNNKIEAAYVAESYEDRAALLHEAEQILLDDAAVIPIVYNQVATVTDNANISKLYRSFFTGSVLTHVQLNDHWNIALRDEFVIIEEEEEEEE